MVKACIIQKKVLPLHPQNDSKAKVSSLTHFAEAEFGNVNLLMLN